MIAILASRGVRRPPPTVRASVTGVTVRRRKTYSAASGWVYEYVLMGSAPAAAGTAYRFEVTAGRQPALTVTVVVSASTRRAWEALHARPLARNEQYALAKLRLLHGFDTVPELTQQATWELQPDEAEAFWSELDTDS